MHLSLKSLTDDMTSSQPDPRRVAGAGNVMMRAIGLAALMGASLGSATLAQPRLHEQLVVGMTSFPPSEHPYIDPLIVKSWVLGFASRQVTMFTPEWQNVCSMCTEVPSLDNGRVKMETQPDGTPGLAVRWTLRKDLFWGDGVPLTTKDIAYTAKVGGDSGSGFPDARVWGRVRSVDVVDAQTIVLHLDEVTPLYNRMGKLLSEHSDGPAFYGATKPGDYLTGTVYNRAPTTPGLWNGPYIITSYDSGSQIVLEPNPHWTGKVPAIKRIVARSIADTAALQANLMSGDVDMAPGDAIGLQLDQVLAMQKDNPTKFQYVYNDALAFWNIDFDLDNKFLADVRVRRAILLAIDRKTMSERLAGGRFTLAATWVPPKEPMFAPGLPVAPYDPAQARALLKEAGYTPGPDGILRNAQGERFSIELHMGLGVRLMELVELVVQNQLKAVGIDVVLRNEVQRTFFGTTLKHRQYGGLALYNWLFNVRYPPRQLYGLTAIPTEANGWGGSNYMDWKNQAFEDQLKIAETTLGLAEQKAAWANMQRLYLEDLPALPLFFVPQAHVIPIWLKGYVPSGMTDYTTLRAEDWHAE